MLDETEAWSLLKRYGEPLRDAKWIRPGYDRRCEWNDVAREQVDLIIEPINMDKNLRRHGARLRLALGFLQAISHCRGFTPTNHQSFWRAVLLYFQIDDNELVPEEIAVSHATFDHIGIAWSVPLRVQHGVAFWMGFMHGTPATDAPPPPLRVSLSRCIEHDGAAVGNNVDLLPFLVRPNPVVDPVALRYAATVEVLDLLTHVVQRPHLQLMIDRVTLQLAPPTLPRSAEPTSRNCYVFMSRAHALGTFLHRVQEHAAAMGGIHTLAVCGCSHTDFRLVGTALSIASQLPISALRCSGLFYATQPHDKLLRLAWFVGETIDPQERDYMMCLVARSTPLRGIVGETLRLRCHGCDDKVAGLTVTCLRLGSTVEVARATKLYFEPMRSTDEYAAVTLNNQEEVDAVAVVAECGGHDDEQHDGNSVSSLALTFEGSDAADMSPHMGPLAHRIDSLLRLLTSNALATLSLDRVVISRADLLQLLESCPQLHTLNLDRCIVECIGPLLDVYKRPTCPRVVVLSLLGVRDLRGRAAMVGRRVLTCDELSETAQDGDAPLWLPTLIDALARGVARDDLRELHVDLQFSSSTSIELKTLERLAAAVASSALSLARLHVTCRRELQGACAALLGPMRDIVLRDPVRVRNAVLSVLNAFHCSAPETAKSVLAMAEGGAVRTITWDWNENWSD